MSAALSLTAFHVLWSFLWGAVHVRIRRGRKYARGRPAVGPIDRWYRRVNPMLFVGQLGLSVACLWNDWPGLLQFHHSVLLRWGGATLLTLSLGLTWFALRHLGDNYSPCYDSHLPRTLTTSGPYALIRHPMYLAKILAGLGTVLFSGSLWFLPSTAYLVVVTLRALREEESELMINMPGYGGYAARTRWFIPHVF
jgi:protein-S-isoprenylcysteine O-methyltransferase Ste14